MINYLERPICRSTVERMLRRYDCTLEDILQGKYGPISYGVRCQIKKMLWEKDKETLENKLKEVIYGP